jgi:Zn-dependent oligopeptidase
MTEEEKNNYIAAQNDYIANLPKIADIAKMPEDFVDARTEALEAANGKCVVKKDNCMTQPVLTSQKKLIITNGINGYERVTEGVMQTSDNLVVCCSSCHSWIDSNPEEATALGYLDR